MIKKIIKRMLFKKKGVLLDKNSDISYKVVLKQPFHSARVIDSKLEIREMGDGCFFEHVISYGNIKCGNYVSISGPGTILHAVTGTIQIGSFTSIAQNVSIQEFNHNMEVPSTSAMQFNFFSHDFADDVCSKGDIIIGEDVWVGSNTVILSGVSVGRGAVIAAGSVVTKDVLPYAVVGGVPARIIKMRFSKEQIETLEASQWWTWDRKKIVENKNFFESKVCGS